MEGEKQKINHAEGSKALKKMIPQLLISVSLFSFLLSYSSCTSSLPSFSSYREFHRYFFSSSFNKNCLFLICNGLLVFLSKTSGFIHPPASHEYLNDDLLHFKITNTFQRSYDDEFHHDNINAGLIKTPADQVSIFIADEKPEEDVIKTDNNNNNQSSCWLFHEEDDGDGELLYGDHDDDDDENDDDEEEEEMMMSTEELNKKFEDFIRRMKEEIIINEASNSHKQDKLLLLN